MVEEIRKQDLLLLVACLGLGVLAEISFLHGQVGVSYPIFLFGFYTIIFLRFKLSFNHRRIGLLMMVSIWILSANFLFYDDIFFHTINTLLIPVFVFAHIVLITSSGTIKWGKPKFILFLFNKLIDAYRYLIRFLMMGIKGLFKNTRKSSQQIMIRIILGLIISIPLLFVVIALLMSADAMFESLVLQLPEFMVNINIELLFRIGFIGFVSLLFFGVFQVVGKEDSMENTSRLKINWNEITAITVLLLLNFVYIVFIVIQFTYFFNDRLMEGFTYAEYARRGFLELVIVLLINWTMLISFLKFVKTDKVILKRLLQCLYSILIVVSGIMLVSAFMRLMMYEEAYGFTLSRVLAHSFMIYLMIIFIYTLIRVWLEGIPLLRFYVIIGIIFYTSLNVINVDQFIVDKNMQRYEATGKIDVHYLSYLSSTGVSGLLELYDENPDVEDLEYVLLNEQEYVRDSEDDSWQSFNFARQKLEKRLLEFDVRGDNR